jgi:hypothetical protein
MIKGGIDHPLALIPWIAVTHSLFPGCIVLGLPLLSELVTTLEVDITPI